MSEQKPSHPIQPLVETDSGVLRFKENRIVSYLLDVARQHGVDMNELAVMDFSDEDREQFAQLIGYSASGFCELSYVSVETMNAVDLMADGQSDPMAAENAALKASLMSMKETLKPLVSDLFDIHPDDLK